ncbi:MAG: acyl-CoA dehydrogenase family protein [Candidatus Aminicenantes bacterium]|nr:acyl-CoA dehydrogenase family protein [Candidatus Aminicenantes bacterium]
MNFELSEEVKMIRESVRKFAEEEIRPLAHDLDKKEEFSVELTKKMGELGLFGIFIPEKYGGVGLGYMEYIIAVEEIARIDGSQAATLAAHNSLGVGPIYYYGNGLQKEKYIPALCTGENLWGFGLTEPDAGSDAGGTKTTAILSPEDDKSWIINGSKIFITNASSPITLGSTVQTVTGKKSGGKKEYTCFLVDTGTEGFETRTMHDKMMWRGSNTAELFFDDVRVSNNNLLGERGDGFHIMLDTLDRGRLSISAMGLGAAQGAFDLSLKYARERIQFNKPISTFQGTTFKLSDMAVEIEAARNLLYKAAWLCDNGKDFKKESAMAKLYTSEVAHRCVNNAVQIHGGYGLMKEYEVERLYRDQRVLEIGEGTSEIQRLVIARYLGCYNDAKVKENEIKK